VPLPRPDRVALDAAQGWLGLGSWRDAWEELDEISPTMRGHPEVLQARYEAYGAAKEWELAWETARTISEMLPDNAYGFIHGAYALHELKRTQDAWNFLLPVADRFSEFIIPYNLACYASQLGNIKLAWSWLNQAINMAGTAQIKSM